MWSKIALINRQQKFGHLRFIFRWIVVGTAALFVCAAGFLVANAPMSALAAWLADDSFYYYQIARNIVLGNGATFDTLHWTNGWHPLYMLLCILVQALAGAGSEFAIRVQFVLNTLFYASAVSIVAFTLYKRRGPAAGVLVLILGYSDLGFIGQALSGVELSVVFLGLAIFLYFEILLFNAQRLTDWLARSILISVIVLSRLDLGLFLLPFFVWYGIEAVLVLPAMPLHKLKRLALVFLPFCVIMLCYMAFNVYVFQVPVPISGLVKRQWAVQVFGSQQDSYVHYALYKLKMLLVEQAAPILSLARISLFTRLTILVIFAYGIASRWRDLFQSRTAVLKTERVKRDNIILALGWIGNLFLLGYYSFFQLDTRGWYWGSIYVWTYFTLGTFAGILYGLPTTSALPKTIRLSALAALVFLCLLLPGLSIWESVDFHKKNYNPWDEFYFEAAMWMQNNLPPAETGAAWNAGMIGYFSGLRVTNLDGLANSKDFLPYVPHTNDPAWDGAFPIREYLGRIKPRYVITDYSLGTRDPERTEQFLCSIAQTCTIRYLEYRGSQALQKRWLMVIEMNYAQQN